jgi:hypothetical protein
MSRAYDIPQQTFKTDLAYGEKGERVITEFLEQMSQGSFEVKTDRYRNGRMVVETQQNPQGWVDDNGDRVYVESGINVTTAKWWVYQYATDGAFYMVSVARLKRYLKANRQQFNERTKTQFGKDTDNPTLGYLLNVNHVLDLLTNEDYDQ